MLPLVENPASDGPVRVWVAGCASGEEAYTIATELAEVVEVAGDTRGFRIIATAGTDDLVPVQTDFSDIRRR